MKFLNNIDMNLNQITNLVVQQLGTDPGSPTEGQFWHNTTSHLLKYYNGSAVIALYGATSTNTASKLVLRDSSGDFAANIGTFASVTISGTPAASTDAVTLGYVQSVMQGASPKPSAVAATTAALAAVTYANGSSGVGATLTADANGALSIDDISPAVNDYVLVKNQASALQNGLYKVTATGSAGAVFVLTRAVEMDIAAEVKGAFVFVEAGTSNASTGWIVTTTGTVTMGSTSISWTKFSAVGSYSVSNPLSLSGSTISLTLSSRLTNNGSNQLDLADLTANGSYTSVTVDTYGRVTSGADISSSTGLVTKTASGTFTSRTITGTSAKITVTNGDGVSGNPTLTIASDYVGQTSIVTLGTITTGTWTGTSIAVANGGTGSTTAAGARTNLSAAGLYTTSISGDGSTTAFTVTHSLGNRQAAVHVYDSSYNEVGIDKVNPSTTTSTVTFATAPTNGATYYVTVVG